MHGKTHKTPLYEIPVPSTDFFEEPYICRNAIYFGYKLEGIIHYDGLLFPGAITCRKREERCCKEEQIAEAYDTLVEIERSPWVREIQNDTNKNWLEHWKMKHFMIYFDSAGCFEFIADSWKIIKREEKRAFVIP